MHFLFILIKNTASLDYTIPVLWKLRQEYKDSKISILYCRNYKEELTKNGSFYSSIAKANGIDEYSHQDMIPASLSIILRALRKFDTIFRKIGIPIFGYWSKKVYQQALDNVKKSDSLKKMKPDLVFLDNTSSAHKIVNRYVYDYLLESQCPFILMPHAPHHAKHIAFSPFTNDNPLPANATFWMPFRFEESWLACPDKKDQFEYIGYPGMDTEWLDYLETLPELPVNNSEDSLTCLLVIRRFLDKDAERASGDNQFVYSYEEFKSIILSIKDAIEATEEKIKIIVKPHPSNNLASVRESFTEFGLKNVVISRDSIYKHINEIDFIISFYSTVFFIPCVRQTPLLFIHSSVVDHISSWEYMAHLYSGLKYYAQDKSEIDELLDLVVVKAKEQKFQGVVKEENRSHLREYYPDGALERALESVRQSIAQTLSKKHASV